ncbi:MAG: hypothetical protein IKN45_03035 [Lachnospiraceae bacterium]|nr:hypothetical protein [Lachnospiraceae bacterium]
METDNTILLKDFGNRLMVEFDEILVLYEALLSESREDYRLYGEESREAGIRKYQLLHQIADRTGVLKQDYEFFSSQLCFPTGKMDWDLPFDEEYERVDIELDNMVVDQFFGVNAERIYKDIRKQAEIARKVFFESFAGLFYVCPCCGHYLFDENGDFNICGICKWENDKTQNNDPRFKGGANKDCLVDYRIRFRDQRARSMADPWGTTKK